MPKTANFFAVVKHEQWAVRWSHINVTTDRMLCVCVCVNLKDYHKETERKRGEIKASRRIVTE